MKNNVISYTLTIYRHHKGKSKFVLSVEWSVDVANLNLHPVKVKLDTRCASYNHFLKEYNLTNKYPLLQEGEKLKFTYLKTPNHFKDTVVSFPMRLPKEFDLQPFIDYETQFEKTFIDPIQIILTCIGWNTEKKSTLEDFFG